MATGAQIEATYDYVDELWRVSLGECADVTCAMFDGDFSKTLERAQADKHEYILRQLGFGPGMRVLDVGCGWGGFLGTVRERGGAGVGLTLSPRQYENCRRHGLDVRLLDWKDAGALGRFDAVVSVGAFEHFCSAEEMRAGRQDDIYRDFFGLCASVMAGRGRMFLQTMTWGKRVPAPERLTAEAPRGSDVFLVARLCEFYPGSWLPNGLEQIRRAAAGAGLGLVEQNNGRLDYIETMREWGRRLRRMNARKAVVLARMSRYFRSDPCFLHRLETIYFDYNRRVFERELFDHQRLVFECGG